MKHLHVISPVFVLLCICSVPAYAATSADTQKCSIAVLQTAVPQDTTITAAKIIPTASVAIKGPLPGAESNLMPHATPSGTPVPEHCLIDGNIATPQNNEGVGFRLALPTHWNEKFVFAARAGSGGDVEHIDQTAVIKGYAVATSDTGHKGPGRSFARGQSAKKVDYAYRGNYLSALATKALTRSYYQKDVVRSIAQGCSSAGRATLIFAQRFPKLFDGYLVNAPVLNWTDIVTSNWVSNNAMFAKPTNWISQSKYAALSKAVLESCDRNDGAADGLIQDPRTCNFDPASIQCKAGDGPDCLTVDQVEVVRAFTTVQRNKFGQILGRGWPFTGEEATTWSGYHSGRNPPPLGENGVPDPSDNEVRSVQLSNYVRDFMLTEHVSTNHNWRSFDPDFDLGRLQEDHGLLSSMNPELAPMESRGAKVLFIHGWSDQAVPPQNSIDYVEEVQKKYGKAEADKFLKLFMIPGMAHCTSGSRSADRFDPLAVLEKWLDTQSPPEVITAAHWTREGKVAHTRPLCAWPRIAAYRGPQTPEAISDGRNWVCE